MQKNAEIKNSPYFLPVVYMIDTDAIFNICPYPSNFYIKSYGQPVGTNVKPSNTPFVCALNIATNNCSVQNDLESSMDSGNRIPVGFRLQYMLMKVIVLRYFINCSFYQFYHWCLENIGGETATRCSESSHFSCIIMFMNIRNFLDLWFKYDYFKQNLKSLYTSWEK